MTIEPTKESKMRFWGKRGKKAEEEQEAFLLKVVLCSRYTYKTRFSSAGDAFRWLRSTASRENKDMTEFVLYSPSGAVVEQMTFPL